jgi:GTP cyclohydrolase FolE2
MSSRPWRFATARLASLLQVGSLGAGSTTQGGFILWRILIEHVGESGCPSAQEVIRIVLSQLSQWVAPGMVFLQAMPGGK